MTQLVGEARRRRPWAMRTAVAAAVLTFGSTVATTASAAPEDVDIDTGLPTLVSPVPDVPIRFAFEVNNNALVPASGVVVTVVVPEGVAVTPGNFCSVASSTSGTTIICDVGSMLANHSIGFEAFVTFDAVGTYQFSSSATADQVDVDGDSTATVSTVVVAETADLSGGDPREQDGLAGVMGLTHVFENLGPTAAGLATIDGTFPPGLDVVPGSFHFGSPALNEANDACTLTAATYSCEGVAGEVGALSKYVYYEVVIPPTLSTSEATATITGRNDPNHSNDTSRITIGLRLPAAELTPYLDPANGPWFGAETRTVVAGVVNYGQLPADEVTATFEVPPGWAVDFGGSDTPNRTCATAADRASVTCTYEVLPPDVPEDLFLSVTSPAGPSASGPATFTVSTPTPEHGHNPNVVTRTFEHVETRPQPTVVVTPSVEVGDGAGVDVAVSGFPAFVSIGSAQCEASVPLTLVDCDLETLVAWQTDDRGAATFTRPVVRFIVTDSGLVDCAVEACVLAAATLDLSQSASHPISFDDATVPSPLTVTIDAPAYTSTDGLSYATVPAILECDVAVTVRLRFVLSQLDSASSLTRRGTSIVTVPCTPGSPAEVTSDLIGSMEPGPAEVIVTASAEGTNARAITSGNISLEPFSAILAGLLARLADPNDTTVIPELFAALSWRLQYNPLWAHEFYRAILTPS